MEITIIDKLTKQEYQVEGHYKDDIFDDLFRMSKKNPNLAFKYKEDEDQYKFWLADLTTKNRIKCTIQQN